MVCWCRRSRFLLGTTVRSSTSTSLSLRAWLCACEGCNGIRWSPCAGGGVGAVDRGGAAQRHIRPRMTDQPRRCSRHTSRHISQKKNACGSPAPLACTSFVRLSAASCLVRPFLWHSFLETFFTYMRLSLAFVPAALSTTAASDGACIRMRRGDAPTFFVAAAWECCRRL